MIELIRENISWIRDFFTIVFTGTGTIVAILTYKRAIATILQPIRTEVIRKQSDILSRLLNLLKDYNNSFEEGLDYINLVQTNVIMSLSDYGFVFKEQNELMEKIKVNTNSWLPCGKSNMLKDIEIIGVFSEKEENSSTNKLGLEKYNNLKVGKVDIDKIYLTKQHINFVKTISEFNKDPFIPSTIQNILTELFNDINTNLLIVLKNELEIFLIDFSKLYFEKSDIPLFNPIGVYNKYNHSRIHHKKILENLRGEIRKYLRIDEKW